MGTVIDIDGVDIRSAAILNRDCAFAISSLQRRCPRDQAFHAMPIFYGGWEDGISQPAITSVSYTVDTTASAGNACKAPIVRTSLEGCELTVPNMKQITLSTDVLPWKDLVNRFCRQRNLAKNNIQIFNQQGQLDFTRPHTLNILKMALAATWDVMGRTLVKAALCGDYTDLNEFDGLYTQLANGWVQSTADPCPDALNVEQVIDWAVLTGTGTGTASPDTCTVAGQTVTIWGEVFDVPAGINLAEFLDDLWIEKINNEGMCEGEVDLWEMHVYPGQAKCIQNTVNCMRACSSCDDDPDARDRLSDFRMNQVVELYPSRTMVPIVQSRCMEKNSMRFGPRMIDGEYTYGLFLDDIDKHLSMLPVNPWANTKLMVNEQEQMENSFLCADDWRDDIESRALFWDLYPVSSLCVQGTVQMCAGVVATNRHLWLKIKNVACGSLIGDCDDDITVI